MFGRTFLRSTELFCARPNGKTPLPTAQQAIQRVIERGHVRFAGHRRPAQVYLGGDLPWLKKILGLTPVWQIPSIYSQARWGGLGGWVDVGVQRTADTDRATKGLTPVIGVGVGVKSDPLLLLDRKRVVVCVLHLVMAFGRLAMAWLKRKYDGRPQWERTAANRILTQYQTGQHLDKKKCAPDGEETRRLLVCIADGLCPHMRHVDAREKSAIKALKGLFTLLYRSSQPFQNRATLSRLCRSVAQVLKRRCFRFSKSSYLFMLEYDLPRLLRHIHPYGLAMYCQDTTESLNAKLKLFFLQFTNRGGGKLGSEGVGKKQLSALRQTMQYLFLYFHSYLQAYECCRPCFCANTNLFGDMG